MIVFFWNIRGLANKHSRDVLFNHIKLTSPDVICIAEPMMSPSDFPVSTLRLFNMEIFAFNLRDGVSKIWILLKNNFPTPRICSNSDQEISLDFTSGSSNFRITFVYANVNVSARRRLWQLLPSLALSDTPWLIIGDFNAIRGAHERRGGNPPNNSSCLDFS